MSVIKNVTLTAVGVAMIFFVAYVLDGFDGAAGLFVGSFLMLGGVGCAILFERCGGLWHAVAGAVCAVLSLVLALSGHFLQYLAGGYALYFAVNICAFSSDSVYFTTDSLLFAHNTIPIGGLSPSFINSRV